MTFPHAYSTSGWARKHGEILVGGGEGGEIGGALRDMLECGGLSRTWQHPLAVIKIRHCELIHPHEI